MAVGGKKQSGRNNISIRGCLAFCVFCLHATWIVVKIECTVVVQLNGRCVFSSFKELRPLSSESTGAWSVGTPLRIF